jgi:hypothetical protein
MPEGYVSDAPRRGWWGLPCFNGLSEAQQKRVVEVGNLEIGYQPEGPCLIGAEIEITTIWDEFPGPRFYCLSCGIEYLTQKASASRFRNPFCDTAEGSHPCTTPGHHHAD